MSNIYLVTGGTGMVGNAIKSLLPKNKTVMLSSNMCDLRNKIGTLHLFSSVRPTHVIHLAARVGGVKANYDNLGEFYYDNIRINTNVLEAARKVKVKKMVSLLSTCIYPSEVTYPLTEEQIHNGEPHYTNFAYAYAKRMLDVQSRAYREQYGCNFITAVPNNLYGKHDNFDLEDGHVIPALIRKIWEAKLNNTAVEIWGDGTPLREFTYSEDIAKALLFLLENYEGKHPINIGNTKEHSIVELVENLCYVLGYNGEIMWNTTKLGGQYKKPSSNKKFLKLGWDPNNYTSLEEGLKETCKWFKMRYPKVRGHAGD
jgi:GDP-L-fucose synthase